MYKDGTRPAGVNAEVQARRVAIQHQITLAGSLGQLCDAIDFADTIVALDELEVLTMMCQEAEGEALKRALLEVAGFAQMWLEAIVASEAR